MSYLILDIETIPNEASDIPTFDPDSVRVGNIKDPDKIAEKIEEAKRQFESGMTKTMSLSSNLCRIVSLGMVIVENQKIVDKIIVYGKDSDEEILKAFNSTYRTRMKLVGWNSKQFDIPIVWKRGILTGNRVEFDYLKMISRYHDNSIDLMHVWNAYEYGKLSDCAKSLKIPCKTGLDGSMIYDAWKHGMEDEIKAYNLEDCMVCYEIGKAINLF